jgi:nicotinamidase-related amidase
MLLDYRLSALLLVDLQEKLIPAMHEPATVIANSMVLMAAATRLGVPITITEQYPQGLGATIADIADGVRGRDVIVPKLTFSAAGEPGVASRLRQARRAQIVVAGVEAHVCVLQTAIGLQQTGYQVFVAADAITARKRQSTELALERLRQNGVSIVNTEMTVFEWLGRAGTDEFREISRLIR